MNRKELLAQIQANALSKGVDLNKKDLGVVFNTVLETIGEAVLDGARVSTTLGTFKLHHSAEREGFNPRNHEQKLIVKARDRVAFSASKKFVRIQG